MFYLTSIIVFFLDQLIKRMVAVTMAPNQTIPLIKNVLHLTYVQNQGAAFGMFWGLRALLVLVGIIIIAFIIYFYHRAERSLWMSLALGCLVGGSLGNLVDRIFRHYVVDFIDFRFWPVFNLADIMINTGVFLVIILLLFNKEGGNAPHTT
ncbi:MAG: signal peptidase II [Candidatus Margulisiibacteriota bacterium]